MSERTDKPECADSAKPADDRQFPCATDPASGIPLATSKAAAVVRGPEGRTDEEEVDPKLRAACVALVLGFVVTIAAFALIDFDPRSRLPSIGDPGKIPGSLGPMPGNKVILGITPRKEGELRVYFVGASETYALPYEPPGVASYGFQLGAGLRAVLGREDVHARAEGNPALDSPQIVEQALKIVAYGSPTTIVLVVGANEYLNRIVLGRPMSPDEIAGRIGDRSSLSRVAWYELEDWIRSQESLAGLLRSKNSTAFGQGGFVGFTRQARPGWPAIRGLPVGQRDTTLLVERLRAQIRRLHRACEEKGCELVLALSLHGMDGARPWCSHVGSTPKELNALLQQSFDDPQRADIAKLDAWLSTNPDRADLHYGRARALRAQGRGSEARVEFERALDLDIAPLHQTREIRELLVAEAKALGIVHIDLNDAFRDEHGVTGPDDFLDYAHLTLEGHRRLARWLARKFAGKQLPELPDGWEAKFDAATKAYCSAYVTKSSIELAQARMSLNLGRYYMVFGNFRDALPHLEVAEGGLRGKDEGDGPLRDLEFCREKLAEVGR